MCQAISKGFDKKNSLQYTLFIINIRLGAKMDNNDQTSIPDTGITEGKTYPLDLFIQEHTPESITKTRFMKHISVKFDTTVQNLYRLIRNRKGTVVKNNDKVSFYTKMAECPLSEIQEIPDS